MILTFTFYSPRYTLKRSVSPAARHRLEQFLDLGPQGRHGKHDHGGDEGPYDCVLDTRRTFVIRKDSHTKKAPHQIIDPWSHDGSDTLSFYFFYIRCSGSGNRPGDSFRTDSRQLVAFSVAV